MKVGLDIVKVHDHTKIHVRRSNGSAGKALNYRHTHWTDSITSIADEEGKKQSTQAGHAYRQIFNRFPKITSFVHRTSNCHQEFPDLKKLPLLHMPF